MMAERRALALIGLVALLACGHAIHLPGLTPISYPAGAPVVIKVNSLTSTSNVMPMPWYSMPWCAPSKEDRKKYRKSQNLGENLWGDQIEMSMFHAEMLVNATCRTLCPTTTMTKDAMQLLTKRVEENYRGHLVLDSLPVAEEGSSRRGRFASQAVTGFPLGVSKKYTGNGQTFINNHLAFTILYHEHVPAVYIATEEEPADSYRIVGFQVTPMSVDHAQSPCDDKFNPDTTQPLPTTSEHVTWTYSVSWAESEIEWSTRWDVYLKASIAESRIHWLSIVNSSLVVVLLSVVIAIILIRALKRDLARYNSPEAMEEEREETGWKLVHGDVFRKPEGAGLLYIYVGTGVQLLGMCASTIGIAVLGFLSPANRGGLLTTLIFLFVLLGSFCGYTTARLAKMHKMTSWKLAITSGVYFPGQMFLIYFMLNFVHWGSHASSAVPFTSILMLFALWFCVSLPLVVMGAAVGFRRAAIEPTRRVNSIARTIPPQPWYLTYPWAALIPGILPFGCSFIELVFILSSVWQGRVYYVFGFLALVFIILVVTCAEATIVMVYFQLLNLDYQWWWRSFFTGGSYGAWLFLYSVFYYVTALSIRSWWGSVLYFSYMFMASYFFFVMTGAVGFLAAFAFVNKIYGSIKVDQMLENIAKRLWIREREAHGPCISIPQDDPTSRLENERGEVGVGRKKKKRKIQEAKE